VRPCPSPAFATPDGTPVPAVTAAEMAVVVLAGAGVVVDALVGYGLTGALRGRAAALVAATPDRPTVSLDVPSGVDADTGAAPGPAVDPDRTLTLALPKPGLARTGGLLELADLGIPAGVYEAAGVTASDPFDGVLRVPLDCI
jgi:NAD(P)H-hydrate epimerase